MTPMLDVSPPRRSELVRNFHAHRVLIARLVAALAALCLLVLVLRQVAPLLFDVAALREAVASWGWRGVAIYLAAFAVRDLTRVPGFVMAGLAVVAFDGWAGPALAYVGATVSALCGFAAARLAAGRLLTKCRSVWIDRLLGWVEAHPLRTVIVARSVIGTTAALNVPFAMSRLTWRQYATGTAIGLLPYVTVLTAVTRLSFG